MSLFYATIPVMLLAIAIAIVPLLWTMAHDRSGQVTPHRRPAPAGAPPRTIPAPVSAPVHRLPHDADAASRPIAA